MLLVDVNVLVHAFREDAVDHDRYAAWLDGLMNGDQAFGIADWVLSGLLRVVTHPKIFAAIVKMLLMDWNLSCSVLHGQKRKKPTWRNTRRYSTTSAYSLTSPSAPPSCSLSCGVATGCRRAV